MCLSTALDISCARFTSPALIPICSLSSLKKSIGLSPRGLILDNILSIKSLFDSSSVRLLIMVFIAGPEPPTRPSSSELSKPNFNLFMTSRAASFSLFGRSCVGPKSKASPSVPTLSGSPTNIASATPIPAAPPSVAYSLPFAFSASSIFGAILGSDGVKYLPAFLENIAFFASPVPIFHACEPGIPRLVIIRAISPAVLCSAISSKLVKLSKKFSTLAAVLVPRPKSISDAPSENAPFGMSITPAAIPANTACMLPILLLPTAPLKPPPTAPPAPPPTGPPI